MSKQINFKSLIDVEELQKLTDDLYAATAIPSAIIAMDGEILTGSGWQRICTDFHRVHPDTSADCIASDIAIHEGIEKGEEYVIYKCPRGLVDASAPVILEGEHVANVFAGQLFTNMPGEDDEKAFREAARKYGFDETAYIDAYREIPILSEENFKPILKFLSGFAKLVATIGLARIKERQATEEIHTANHKYLRLLQSTKIVPWELDLDTGKFTYMGPQAADLFGYPLSYWQDMDAWTRTIHPEDREWASNFCSAEIKKGKDHEFTYRMLTKNGRYLWIQDIVSVINDEAGPMKLAGFMHDVTESMRAKEKNQHFQELMKYIIEHTCSAIAVHDRDLKYLYVSQSYLDQYEITDRNIIGKHHYEVFPDLPQKWRDVHQRVFNGEVFSAEEDSYLKSDGSIEWTRWECRPWYETDGSIGGLIVYTEIISDRIKAQEKLRESEERFHRMFREHDAIMLLIEPKTGKIVDVNRTALSFYGYSKEEFNDLKIQDINTLSCVDVEKALGKATAGSQNHFEFKHRLSNGETRDVEVHVSKIEIHKQPILFSIVHDISHRKKLMEEQSRSAQLAALGTVAAGVAHEINNPIQGIMNYASLIRIRPENIERNLEIANRIIDESKRIAKITRDLLFYSKDSRIEMRPVDLKETIESALSLIASKVRKETNCIETNIQEGLPRLLLQPQSIQQVIINLVDNAIDALRDKPITAGKKKLLVCASLLKSDNKQELCLEVQDNGIGMSEEVARKSQEAFFTTKPPSEGTGLGLSIVNDIVKKHNGHIEIDSKEGQYTKIKIFLPAITGIEV